MNINLIKFGIGLGYILFMTLVLVVNHVQAAKLITKKPDNMLDILVVKETVKKQFDDIWKFSESVYSLHENTTAAIMNDYWTKLIQVFTEINDLMKYFDRKIQRAQPSTLMNILFYTEDMASLGTLAKTPTTNASINWHVRFLELSSLMTQANWFYNKRIFDILQANKYLHSVAESIRYLYGYPWIAPISVKKGGNITSRLQMKEFWHLSAELIERTHFGDIFYGIRKLIDERAEALGSASYEDNSCIDNTFGIITPIRFDAPLYVYFYFALFHIKMYIIRNFNFVYQEVYDGIVVPNKQEKIHNFMEQGVAIAMDHYNNSFWNYSNIYAHKMDPVMRGYFLCDPEEPNFIEVTNFLNIFLTPQAALEPDGQCENTCLQIGQDASKVDCTKPKDTEKEFCEKLPCPLDQIQCLNESASSAIICPSSFPNQLYEWFVLGEEHYGPESNCSEDIIGMDGLTANSTFVNEGAKGRAVYIIKKKKPKKHVGPTITDNREEETTTEIPTTTEPPGDPRCQVCMCKCAAPINIKGQKNSARVFSLKDALANIEENRVIVGAKFEKLYDQIHLMIADAKLLPSFYVNMSTIEWRHVTPVDPQNASESIELSLDLRQVYLKSWKVKPNYVITGLRFIHSQVTHKNTSKVEKYIGLQIRQTRIDDQNGTVSTDEEDSEWPELESEKDFTETPRYTYKDPDTPLNLDGLSFPDSAARQLIEFGHTSLKKHAGQTIVPFFDAQKVVFPKKPYALKGLGIYHRHKVGFGGFLAFKLLPYEDKHLK